MSEMQEPTFAPGFGPNDTPGSDSSGSEQQDYFGFQSLKKFFFPDGVTWIEFTVLNEGQKKNFQDKTSSDMVVERRSGDARMTLKQGTQRHELLKAACVNWNLKRNVRGTVQEVPFGAVPFNDFLTLGDPRIIENLEKEIRKANPWLMADMTADDIRKEIENLEELLKVKVAEEAGEAS